MITGISKEVEAALDALRKAIESASREQIKNELRAVLGNGTVVLNSVIRGNLIVPDHPFDPAKWDEPLHSVPQHINEENSCSESFHRAAKAALKPIKPKRKYRRSAAGRARQIAAMKKYWAKRRARKGKAK